MDLKRALVNITFYKIVRFFHENPASVDTPRGIATWTDEDLNKVKSALRKLTELGVLVSHDVSSTTGYSYTRDKRVIKKIEKLLGEPESK